MPVKLEAKLRRVAVKRGYPKERADAYVYGTIEKLKAKGAIK